MVLGALWEMAETDAGGVSVDSDYWRVAAMFPFGQHELHWNYGLVDADGDRGAQQWTIGSTSTLPATSPAGAQYTSIAVRFRHNF